MTLTNLPAHTNLTLGFDLFLINTWDGSGAPGPDLFDVWVEGGPTLLHASFANYGHAPQSFPGTYRNEDWPGFTGALEVGTLDYKPDSVYRLSFIFPHAANQLQLHFQGANLQSFNAESWGLDNVILYSGGPTITWTGPTNHSVFTTPTNLVLSAEAAAGSANILSVEFLANNVLLGTVTHSPYALTWSNVSAGVSYLTARATDEQGHTAVSQATITVNGLVGEYFNNTNWPGQPSHVAIPPWTSTGTTDNQ